jgi:bacteriocin biosynthesis cyclodehydratase domain-containing protein
VHPILKPGVAPRTHSPQAIAFGEPGWRHVLLPRTATVGAVLTRLTGTHSVEQIVNDLEAEGFDAHDVTRTLRQLDDAGMLDDAARRPRLLRRWASDERLAVARDVDGWSAASASPSDGRERLARRRGCWIAVMGSGRLADEVVDALAFTSIGHVLVVDAERGTASSTLGADLVLHVGAITRAAHDAFLRHAQPHLVVRAVQGHGVVGPLVVPGRTSCMQCARLHRGTAATELLLDEVANGAPDAPIDRLTARHTAAMAVMQAVQQIEQRSRPLSIDTELIISPDGGSLVQRPLPPHRQCACRLDAPPAIAA